MAKIEGEGETDAGLDSEALPQEGPSKSAVKRAMHALQDLGTQLVGLSERELARMPIEDAALERAIAEARRIRSNSARKRQLQYIGKLMRQVDTEPLARALEELHQQKNQQVDKFHQLEALRDSLLERGQDAIEDVLRVHPQADRQHLRQLIRQHQREQGGNKPPAAARKLFKYLREIAEY